MSTHRRSDPKFVRTYDREVMRSAFVSLFWAVISHLKKRDGFTLIELARRLGTNKAEVSRWFNSEPNWTLSTVGAIASALNLDITITATDRVTGQIFTPSGLQTPMQVQTKVTSPGDNKPETVRLTRTDGVRPEKIAGFSDAA